MAEKNFIRFEASARLQRLIGRELIPNDQMAVVELVKNAYDSGATEVRIFIQPERARQPSYITVSDNGSGMSITDIEQLFMFAGYSEKTAARTKKARIPTGEKGIGRFAADKLGATLQVITQKKDHDGILLNIDWREFERNREKRFSEIKASYEITNLSRGQQGTTGTTLRIEHLRSLWKPGEVQRLIEWLTELFNPFDMPKNFRIKLEVGGSRTGAIEIKPMRIHGDLTMQISVSNGHIKRTIKRTGTKIPLMNDTQKSSLNLDTLEGVKGRFEYFFEAPKKEQTHGRKGGVRVFRDGFRIEPFGSPNADWLGISERRAKRAGHALIVPNRIFGFISISRKQNDQLSDTTSRQALVDSESLSNLVSLLRVELEKLEDILLAEKEPVWAESQRNKGAKEAEARLQALDILASGLAHELRQPLQIILTESNNIKRKLEIIGVIDRDINDSEKSIENGIKRIDSKISFISDLAKGNPSEPSECDLATVVKDSVDFFINQCKEKNIELNLRSPQSQPAYVNEVTVRIALINLIRNSIESLDADGGDKITVKLSQIGGHHHIEVSDNGVGVNKNIVSKLFSKFTTVKTGGMGIGLYLCKSSAMHQGGDMGYEPSATGATFWLDLPDRR